MRREIDRIRFIMSQSRQLLPIYLARHKENALLARYLFSQNALGARGIRQRITSISSPPVYGEHPERMFVLAAQSLRLGGWVDEAAPGRARCPRHQCYR